MYCVIQEIQRKKPNPYGYDRELEAYSPFEFNGRRKYAYRYTGGKFERPIRTAYKVSIHESERVGGVVTKKQCVVTTVDYYSLAEYWIGDCFLASRLDTIAVNLDTTTEHLWELINVKVDPLEARIKAEFAQTEEYKTHTKHEATIQTYQSKKHAFAKGWEVDPDTYDYCYDVFGNVVNQAYLDEINAASEQKQQSQRSYQKTTDSNYSSYDYSKLFGPASSTYSDEDKGHLKKFYKSLSKIYHPDMNRDVDTHAEMVLLNKLKEEWGV